MKPGTSRHALDPPRPEPDWNWPYPCHHHGHVYEVGLERCVECHLPYRLDPAYMPAFDEALEDTEHRWSSTVRP